MSIRSLNMRAATMISGPAALRQRRLAGALLIGAVIVALVMRLPLLQLPLERDEGAYAYVAWRWLQGALPYRDLFDHKPPLIYLLYLPPLLLADPSAPLVRLWSTLLFLPSLGLVACIGRRIWTPVVAALATLLFAVSGSAFHLQGLVLNTDQALVLPALAALWTLLRWSETGAWRSALATGMALAAAVLIKPVALLLVPIALAAVLRRQPAGRAIAAMAAGAAILVLPCLGYFAAHGALDDLWYALVTYNQIYAGESRARWSFGALMEVLAPLAPLLLAAMGGVATLPRHTGGVTPTQGHGWLLTAWALALLLAALLSLRPYIHYFYPMLPFLSLLAAACVAWLWRQRGESALERGAASAAALLLALLLIGPLLWPSLRLIGASPEHLAERLYGDEGRHYFAQAPLVAAYIRRHTPPDAAIHVFAAEPEIYLLAQRRAVSRYIYDYPLALIPDTRAELRRALTTTPPALIVTYHGTRPDGFWETVQAQNFEKLAEIGGYELFGRP